MPKNNMSVVLRWIILVWSIASIPYIFYMDWTNFFFQMIYTGLVIGIMIIDLNKKTTAK